MGYYEVTYRNSAGQTKTTSGHSLSTVKSRITEAGGTYISAKYYEVNDRSLPSEYRSGIPVDESAPTKYETSYPSSWRQPGSQIETTQPTSTNVGGYSPEEYESAKRASGGGVAPYVLPGQTETIYETGTTRDKIQTTESGSPIISFLERLKNKFPEDSRQAEALDKTIIRLDSNILQRQQSKEVADIVTSRLSENIVSRPIDEGSVYVTYEKEGETGTNRVLVKTKNINNFEERHGVHIIHITNLSGSKVYYDAPTSSQYQEEATKVYQEKYMSEGIPTWYKERVNAPEELKKQGLITESEWENITYQATLGYISEETMNERLTNIIEGRKTIDWYKQHGVWTDESGKTFTYKQMKKEQPAMFLTETGEWEYNPARWEKQEHKRAEQQHDYGYLVSEWFGQVFSKQRFDYGVAGLKGPTSEELVRSKGDYIKATELMGKRQEQILAEGHYELYQKYRQGDYLGIARNVLQNPLVLGIVSFGAGYGFTLGFQGLKSIGIGLLEASEGASTLGKFMLGYSKFVPVVSGATISGIVGVNIGYTAAMEKKGLIPEGETLRNSFLFGTAIAGGYFGSQAAMGTIQSLQGKQTVVGREYPLTGDKTLQELGISKYIDVFGKRIYYGYKPIISRSVLRGGFEPDFTTYKGNTTPTGFRITTTGVYKPTGYVSTEPIPQKWALVPYTPKAIVPYTPSYSFTFLDVKPSGIVPGDPEIFEYLNLEVSKFKSMPISDVLKVDFKTITGDRQDIIRTMDVTSKKLIGTTTTRPLDFKTHKNIDTHTYDWKEYLNNQIKSNNLKIVKFDKKFFDEKSVAGFSSKDNDIVTELALFKVIAGNRLAPRTIGINEQTLKGAGITTKKQFENYLTNRNIRKSSLDHILKHETIHDANDIRMFEAERIKATDKDAYKIISKYLKKSSTYKGITEYQKKEEIVAYYHETGGDSFKFTLESDIADWLNKYTPVKPEESLIIRPETKIVPYKSYTSIGWIKLSITPYTSKTGGGLTTKFEMIPYPQKQPIQSILNQPTKPFVRTIDTLTGKQTGHGFIDLNKSPIIKEYQPPSEYEKYMHDLYTDIKEYGISETTKKTGIKGFITKPASIYKPEMLSFDIVKATKGDVLKGWDKITRSLLGKYKPVYDITTYKGETKPAKDITSLVLHKGTALVPRNLFHLYGTKPIIGILVMQKPEPIIKSIKGFGSKEKVIKEWTLKDLTKKWEMEKSDISTKPIEMKSGEQILQLKPPVTKTETIQIQKPTTEKIQPQKTITKTPQKTEGAKKIDWGYEKVPLKKLIEIGRFDIEVPILISPTTQIQKLEVSTILKPKTDIIKVHKPIQIQKQGQITLQIQALISDMASARKQEMGISQAQALITSSALKQNQQLGLSQAQVQALTPKQITEQIIEQTQIKLKKRFHFDLDLGGEPQTQQQEKARSFYPMIKSRSDMPYQRATLTPMTKTDAMKYAAIIVGEHKQASFKLEPSNEKPTSPPNKLERFPKHEYYYNEKKNIWVEKNKYRINSPGELAEITMKGIEARTKGINTRGMVKMPKMKGLII